MVRCLFQNSVKYKIIIQIKIKILKAARLSKEACQLSKRVILTTT